MIVRLITQSNSGQREEIIVNNNKKFHVWNHNILWGMNKKQGEFGEMVVSYK